MRERKSYLLLLQQPSPAVRRDAARQLADLGATVVAQFGNVAIEVLATEDQAAAIATLGAFSARLKGPMKAEHLEKLTAEQLQIVSIWNARFGESYQKLADDRTHADKPWNAPGFEEPLPFTAINPGDFL